MILEHVELNVIPGQEAEYEAAFAEAKTLISASPGFISLRLSRCIERPNVYLLLVEWSDLDAHMVGFRNSELFPKWRALLHHFYDPAPTVEHFEIVVAV